MRHFSTLRIPLSILFLGSALGVLDVGGIHRAGAQTQPSIFLAEVEHQGGLDFEHFGGRTQQNFIIETVTCGLATFDYNNDGLVDIYLPSGSPLLGAHIEPAPTNRLFRNDGGFKFTDVTEAARAGELGFALGVAVADYDNDGDQDLFISNFGSVVLLENNGDGTFTRRELANTHDAPQIGAGMVLLDVDGDGNLDLYVANYVLFDFSKGVSREIFGVPAAPGPKDYLPDRDSLYRNMGDGSFVDVSVASGIAAVAGPGMGAVSLDFNGDGRPDIFVCNDSAPNFLFENLGDFKFEEAGLLSSLAYDVTGSAQASMGVDIGDFNRDGLLDLVTTNFADETPTLYENSGEGYFDDRGPSLGLGVANRHVTWGVAFADFDNDGWLDLMIAAGHLIDSVSALNSTNEFAVANYVLKNMQGQKFMDVSADSPAVKQTRQVTRGLAVEDFDNDGAMDAVLLNLNGQPQLLRNESPDRGHYLHVSLVGSTINRDAVGALVTVEYNGAKQLQSVVSGRGYQSHYGSRLHFGLAEHAFVDAIEVRWPNGETQRFEKTAADQSILIREGVNQLFTVGGSASGSSLGK